MANFANDSTDRLREMQTRGGEGVQNPENFAYVLNGCSLMSNCFSFLPEKHQILPLGPETDDETDGISFV